VYQLKYIFQTHCAASTVRNLVTAKMRAKGEKSVPSVVRLEIRWLVLLGGVCVIVNVNAKLKPVKQHLPYLLQSHAAVWRTLAHLERVCLIATPLEEQQHHRIRQRRKQNEPSDVHQTSPLVGEEEG